MDYVHLGFLLLRWPLKWFNYEEAGFYISSFIIDSLRTVISNTFAFLSLNDLLVVEKSLPSVFAFLFLSCPNMLSKGFFFVCGNQNGLTTAPRNHLFILNDSSGDPLKKIFI